MSAVRFERINNEEASDGTKEIPRFMPKIRKRKSNSDDESDSSTEGDDMANDYVMSVQGDNTDQVSNIHEKNK